MRILRKPARESEGPDEDRDHNRIACQIVPSIDCRKALRRRDPDQKKCAQEICPKRDRNCDEQKNNAPSDRTNRFSSPKSKPIIDEV